MTKRGPKSVKNYRVPVGIQERGYHLILTPFVGSFNNLMHRDAWINKMLRDPMSKTMKASETSADNRLFDASGVYVADTKIWNHLGETIKEYQRVKHETIFIRDLEGQGGIVSPEALVQAVRQMGQAWGVDLSNDVFIVHVDETVMHVHHLYRHSENRLYTAAQKALD